ncbi:MAG: Digeranylgeranylglycerophospholipid reductase [Candidatus Bathyarchaeota archaeon BA1]|nr:MAG: Digeranylgeranylglycerophospholipid reductase [Candidatus Bathyarchaeota archaeon BA1]
MMIDAEGATPRLLKNFGLKAKKNPLVGLQYEISNVDFHSSDCVELYFGRHIAPGFFVWIVPLNDGRARVGLCIGTKSPKTSAYKYLKWFMKYHPIAFRKLRNGKIEKVIVGRNPAGLINRSFTDRVLVVGDSAGHVKPTTGGGIYFALKGGEISGETAVECSMKGDFSSKCLQTYETAWKSLIGGELRFTSLARKILNSLWDKDLDRIFQLIAEDKRIVETIETYGDTAYQSRLLRPVVRKLARASLTKVSDTLFLLRVTMTAIIAMLI